MCHNTSYYAQGFFLQFKLLQIFKFGLECCYFLYFEAVVRLQTFVLKIFDMLETFELSVEFVMPGVKNSDLEEESGHADAETGDGQVSLPKHLFPNRYSIII